MDENKKNTITWIVLVILTTLSWQFSESLAGKIGIIAIILAAVIKFFGVSLQFLELKRAHGFWKYGLLTFLIIFYLVIYLNI